MSHPNPPHLSQRDRNYDYNKIISTRKVALDVKDDLIRVSTGAEGVTPISLLDAKKRFQKYMGKRRYYYDLVRYNDFIDHFATITEEIETFNSCYEEFFDNDINCKNNVEMLFSLWDYLNLNKGFLGELAFSISDLSSILVKPLDDDFGISTGQVVFDEVCSLLTFVLMTDARFIGNIYKDPKWQKLLLHKPLNLLTWQSILQSVMPINHKRSHLPGPLSFALLTSVELNCECYSDLKKIVMLLFNHPAMLILMQFSACESHLNDMRVKLLTETIMDPKISSSLLNKTGEAAFLDEAIEIILTTLARVKTVKVKVTPALCRDSRTTDYLEPTGLETFISPLDIGPFVSPLSDGNVENQGIKRFIKDLVDVLITWTKSYKNARNFVSTSLNTTDAFNCNTYADPLRSLIENVLLPSNFSDQINRWDYLNPTCFYAFDKKVTLQSLYLEQLNMMHYIETTFHLISNRESESFSTNERVIVISTLLNLCLDTQSFKDAQSKSDRIQYFDTVSSTKISNSSMVSYAYFPLQDIILEPSVKPSLTRVEKDKMTKGTCCYTGLIMDAEGVGETWVYAQHFLEDGIVNDVPTTTTPKILSIKGHDLKTTKTAITLESFVTSIYAIDEITWEEENLRMERLDALEAYLTQDREAFCSSSRDASYFNKIPPSAIRRSIPIGFDRNQTQYWVFVAQESYPCESLFQFVVDRANCIKHEPCLFVKLSCGGNEHKWYAIRPSKIRSLLVLLKNSPLKFERSLYENIVERLAFTKKKLSIGVAYLKQLQVEWLSKYDMKFIQVFRHDLAALLESQTSSTSSSTIVKKLNIFETYYNRCVELRSFIHYALVYKGEPELIERSEINDNPEIRRKRIKRLREVLMDETFDHHPSKGFSRNDAFQRIREIICTTTAARLMADGDIFNNYKFNMNRSQIRLMMDDSQTSKWKGVSDDSYKNKPLLGTFIGYDHRPVDLGYNIPNALIKAAASEEDAETLRLLQVQRFREIAIPVGSEFYIDTAQVTTIVKQEHAEKSTVVTASSPSRTKSSGSTISASTKAANEQSPAAMDVDALKDSMSDSGCVDKVCFSDDPVFRPSHWLPEWGRFGPEGVITQARKAVVQMHAVTGNTLRIYASGRDAAAFLGVSQSGISLCCSGGKNEAYGFKWKFYEGPTIDLSTIKNEQASYNQLITMQITKNGKKVVDTIQDRYVVRSAHNTSSSSLSSLPNGKSSTLDGVGTSTMTGKQIREDKFGASEQEFQLKCKFMKSRALKERLKEDPIITSSFYVNEKVGAKFEAPPPPLPLAIVDSSSTDAADKSRAGKRLKLMLPTEPVYDLSELTTIDPTKSTAIAHLNEVVYNDHVVVSREVVSIKLLRIKTEILNVFNILPEKRFLFTEQNMNSFKKIKDEYLEPANEEYFSRLREVTNSIQENLANDAHAFKNAATGLSDKDDLKALDEAYAKVFAAHKKCIERVKRYFYRKIGLGLLLWNIQMATQPCHLYDIVQNVVQNVLVFKNDRAIKDFDKSHLPAAPMIRTSNDVALYIFALDRALRYDNSEFSDPKQNPANAYMVRRYGKPRVNHVSKCYVNPTCNLLCSHLLPCKTTTNTTLKLPSYGDVQSSEIKLRSRILGIGEIVAEEPVVIAAPPVEVTTTSKEKSVSQKVPRADKSLKRKSERGDDYHSSATPKHTIFEIAYDSFDHPVIAEKMLSANVLNYFDVETVVPYLPPRHEIKDIVEV